MTKLLRWAGAVLCGCALVSAAPVLAGSPFNDNPGVAASAGAALGPNHDLWAWVSAHVIPVVDQGVLWIVGAVVTFAGLKARQWFGVTITATMEDTLRQTALTGAHLAIADAEGAVDRAGLVAKAVAWMQAREPAIIAKLGFSDQVLAGIAVKMVSAALSGAPAQSALGGSAAAESPAMARADGPHMGGG